MTLKVRTATRTVYIGCSTRLSYRQLMGFLIEISLCRV